MATKASAKNVDFSNVKDQGNFNKKRIPAGDYLATITKIEDAEAKDGIFQYLVSVKINKRPSSVLPYYCKLQENQLWKLRNLLIAAGLTVPKKKIKVDPSRLVGKLIGVTIEDTEYQDKEQSEIAAVFPAAELNDISDDDEPADDDEPEEEPDEDEDEPEEATEDEDEDEDEAEEDPLADLDRAALKAILTKADPDFKARKSQSDDDLRDLIREAQGADEEEPEDEDEPEEEEAPAPKKKAASAKAKTKGKKKPIDEVSDEELEELDIDDL